MKKILVICQYFYPEQFRINDICMEWVNRGYDVTVLTGIPNYPQGKFYKGYGLFKKRREVWNGVKIIRIPLIPRGHTPIGLVLNYFSFPVSGFFWNLFTKVKADYVFMFETSPMTQCKIGVRYAKKHKVPLYLYVQDLWPENVEIVTGIHSPLVIKPIDRMVDKIYKACDQIFVTSPSFVKAVVNRRVTVDPNKVHYWPQYAEEFYEPLTKDEGLERYCKHECDESIQEQIRKLYDDKSFKIAFTGNIGYAQGLDVLPKTAKLLGDSNVRFVIIGDGRYKSRLLEEIDICGVSDKFIMIDRQPAQRIPEILALCDAAFISFMDTELFTWTIPAKLQSYMACGMPIIAAAKGETERVIKEADCGICTGIGDADELAKAIKQRDVTAFKHTYGVNAREYFEKHFDKKMLMDEIDTHFV
ncbi:Glycosyltransferase involved in cell wall bisynthesis [Butyrivibrio fibrisolvens DSM 3071]|uniref:Glycosyltransferase involved in cell wall bisynthesis n=1 Tax=Butyrivibrio fibrisolvens DSM 3071 TaxID=1121131 RepID=A0A1M6ESV8_BUTFI|nr:glycosyltransferase family 4 protein [Butyrivibrio fibrisolvens]SHI88571.1 Glycosyltransferase involved in cell wall bisynthesis [Butyrivibrio fibrisolvens DSM 3071]